MPYIASVLYCTGEDLIARFDERRVRQYLVDDDTTPEDTILLSGDDMSVILKTAISDATAYINMRIQRGQKYSVQDIQEAILYTQRGGEPAPVSTRISYPEVASQVTRMACDLTVSYLMRRRLVDEAAISKFIPTLAETKETLALLQDGKAIFDIQANLDASIPNSPTVSGSGASTIPPSTYNPMYGSFGFSSGLNRGRCW